MEPNGNPETFGYSGYARGPPAHGDQTREHQYSTLSGPGFGASRKVNNVIPKDPRSDIPPAKFIGQEPIRNRAESDGFIARTMEGPHSYIESSHLTGVSYSDDTTREPTGANYSDDTTRESTEVTNYYYTPLKPQRFEMPNHSSYHGELNSKEAEGRLSMASRSLGNNCYLTRYSKNQESYMVSALTHYQGTPTPVHIKLNVDKDNNSYSLEGTEKIFHTLEDLLNYFEQNPLSSKIRGLGTPCLPPDKSRHGTLPRPRAAAGSISSGNLDPINTILQMQEKFFQEMSRQREDHKKELEEERKKQRDDHKKELEEERKKQRDDHKKELEEERKKQRDDHKKELEEERKVYREEIEKEREMNREQLREKEKKDCTIL